VKKSFHKIEFLRLLDEIDQKIEKEKEREIEKCQSSLKRIAFYFKKP